jgi:hypothetical protein
MELGVLLRRQLHVLTIAREGDGPRKTRRHPFECATIDVVLAEHGYNA